VLLLWAASGFFYLQGTLASVPYLRCFVVETNGSTSHLKYGILGVGIGIVVLISCNKKSLQHIGLLTFSGLYTLMLQAFKLCIVIDSNSKMSE